MNFGRAALVLAASSAFLACAQISGLSGFGFGGGGSGGEGTTTSGGGVSSSHGGAAGTGGVGGQGQGGGSPSATGTSTNSATSASASASSAVSSAMSSAATGGLTCTGGDPGVCCPIDHCTKTCCHSNLGTVCQNTGCDLDKILCDSSSDCGGGTICCGYYDGNDYTMGIQCQATCPRPAAAGNPGTYEVCSLTQPVCLTGGVCNVGNGLPGDYGFCF